jgi:hypothetical protein
LLHRNFAEAHRAALAVAGDELNRPVAVFVAADTCHRSFVPAIVAGLPSEALGQF